MASSRKSRRAETARAPDRRADPVESAVATALLECWPGLLGPPAPASRRILVALSGGRDSIVLLHVLAAVRARLPIVLRAAHVHHGLSANADAWAAFCAAECAALSVPIDVERVRVSRARGTSLEAEARSARYAALMRLAGDADALVLAHHADDQAETVLLQWLRGAGPHGLAGMAARSSPRGGQGPVLLRPFLALPAASLAAFAAQRDLRWVEDESNADTRWRRNALRHDVLPAVRAHFPGYPATVVRAAGWQAEAAGLLDELGAIDAEAIGITDGAAGLALDRGRLAGLAGRRPARACNLMRWFLRTHGLPHPSAARLAEMLEQCLYAREGAHVEIAHAGATVGVHRNRIVVHRRGTAPYAVAWQGEPVLRLPGGTLEFRDAVGDGIATSHLGRPILVRSRAAGEHLRLGKDRPARSVAGLFQARRLPLWERRAWPLVWCADRLAAVPGFGVDADFLAAPGQPGITLHWAPAPNGHGADADAASPVQPVAAGCSDKGRCGL